METFTALSDPTRRQIIDLLIAGERSSGDIAAHFSVSAPAVSQHLKVLREAKFVRARIDGQKRIYGLDPRGFEEIEAWISKTRRFWRSRLDELENAIEADKNVARSKQEMKSRRKK